MAKIVTKVCMLKGESGADGTSIKNIEKTATSGNVDTYTINLTDNTKHSFNVTNGTNIKNISKTSTNNNVDTYTITLNSDETFDFTVTNGTNVISVLKTASNNGIDTYTITMSDGSTFPFNVSNAVASVPDAKFSYAYTNGVIAETDTALEAGLYLIVYSFQTFSQSDDRYITISASADDKTKIKSACAEYTIPVYKTVGTTQTTVWFQRTGYIELNDSAKIRLAYSSKSAFSSSVLSVDNAFILKLR